MSFPRYPATKDSGVEWLGEVPEHWEVVRIGALFREAIEDGEDGLPILSVSIHLHAAAFIASDRGLLQPQVSGVQTLADFPAVWPTRTGIGHAKTPASSLAAWLE